MSRNWEKLVAKHCPAGMRVCNCRQAYETFLPAESSGMYNGRGQLIAGWRCKHGCSAACVEAKEIVATAVLGETP